MKRALSSFDVFDTVIARTYAVPEDLAFDLGRELERIGLVAGEDSLPALRREAEHAAWARHRFRRPVTIEDIYEQLALRLGWSVADRERAMQVEISLELAAARAIPAAINSLADCRRQGRAVCFVSDMHLRSAHLRALLAKNGVIEPADRIYASSDLKETKYHRGRLFRLVLKDHRLPGWRVEHVGDHLRSDVLMPRLRMIRGRLFAAARLTTRERGLLGKIGHDVPDLRRSIVASRFARLRHPESPPHVARWVPLLSDAVAPFISAYALWLIGQAKRDGVQRLFFLARDMQVVCSVTTLLARQLAPDLKCVYVHASRAAWQPAAFDGEGDLFWLTDQLSHRSPMQALSRLLDERQMAALHRSGILVADTHDPQLDATLRSLLARPGCAGIIADTVSERRQLLLDYLRQHQFSTHDSALVDAGWRGSLQRALQKALKAAGEPDKVRGYYIGLRHAGKNPAAERMHAFLDSSRVDALGYSLVALTESFLAADHGTTTGYVRSAGTVLPVLAEPPSGRLLDQAQAVATAASLHAEELLTALPLDRYLERLPALLPTPFLHLCARPSAADARILRTWLFDAGRGRTNLVPVTRAPTLRDHAKLLRAILRREREADLYLTGPWTRGSLALANPVTRYCFEKFFPLPLME